MPELEITIPREFLDSMKPFMESMKKFTELTKDLDTSIQKSLSSQNKIQAQQAQIHGHFRKLNQIFSNLSSSLARNFQRIMSTMGPISQIFMKTLQISESVLTGMLKVAGTVITATGYVMGAGVVALRWIWDKMVTLGDTMLQDYLVASGMGTTIGGLRAFRTAFLGLPQDPGMYGAFVESRGNMQSRQFLALKILGIRNTKDTADIMVAATLAAAQFMKTQRKGTELAMAEAASLTALFSPQYLQALYELDEKELREMAERYEANKDKLKISDIARNAWIDFILRIRGMWVKLEIVIADKLADPKSPFVKALTHLSEALVNFVKRIMNIRLTDKILNRMETALNQFGDWLYGDGPKKLFDHTKKLIKDFIRAVTTIMNELTRLKNIFGISSAEAAELKPSLFAGAGTGAVPGVTFRRGIRTHPGDVVPRYGPKGPSAPATTATPATTRPAPREHHVRRLGPRPAGEAPSAPRRLSNLPGQQGVLYDPISGTKLGGGVGGTSASMGAGRHQGDDIMAPIGSPVYAPQDGVVDRIGTDNFGKPAVTIRHADGTYTRYLHMGSIDFKVGDKVQGGQQIGTSGEANGTPHLHFERWNGPPGRPGSTLISPRQEFGWDKNRLPQGGQPSPRSTPQSAPAAAPPAATKPPAPSTTTQPPAHEPSPPSVAHAPAAPAPAQPTPPAPVTTDRLERRGRPAIGAEPTFPNVYSYPRQPPTSIGVPPSTSATPRPAPAPPPAPSVAPSTPAAPRPAPAPPAAPSVPPSTSISPRPTPGTMPSIPGPGGYPTPGGNSLAADRAGYMKELEQNPELKEKVLRLGQNEQGSNPQGTQAVFESMMNRASVRNTTLEQQARWTTERGYYEVGRAGTNAPISAENRAVLEQSLSNAGAGGNVSNYAYGNASGQTAKNKISGAGGLTAEYRSDFNGETFFGPNSDEKGYLKNYNTWKDSVSKGGDPSGMAAALAGGGMRVSPHVKMPAVRPGEPTVPAMPAAPTQLEKRGAANTMQPEGSGSKGTMLFLHGMQSRYGDKTPADIEADAGRIAKAKGYNLEVINVSGDNPAAQEKAARDRIGQGGVTGVIGFSAGGYTADRLRKDYPNMDYTITGAPNASGNIDYKGVRHMDLPGAVATNSESQATQQARGGSADDNNGFKYFDRNPVTGRQTAGAAGIRPEFPVGSDVNWKMMDAEHLSRLNAAYRDMPDSAKQDFKMISGYRPATRDEARNLGMAEHSSQEDIWERSAHGTKFAAAPPGSSQHQKGNASDFERGQGLDWMRSNAGNYGVEHLRGTYDYPHIQYSYGDKRDFLSKEPRVSPTESLGKYSDTKIKKVDDPRQPSSMLDPDHVKKFDPAKKAEPTFADMHTKSKNEFLRRETKKDTGSEPTFAKKEPSENKQRDNPADKVTVHNHSDHDTSWQSVAPGAM